MALKKELSRFLVAGFSAVGTDALGYVLLLNWFDESISKGTSFVLGSVVAFLINKFWTFNSKPNTSVDAKVEVRAVTEVGRFSVLYASTLGVNVGVNQLVLMLLPTWAVFAFLCATGSSTVLNFIGMKFWVFNDK